MVSTPPRPRPPAPADSGRIRPDPAAAEAWLRELLGDQPDDDDGYLQIWTAEEKRSYWFRPSDLRNAARKACELGARGLNAYYGLCLRDRGFLDGLPPERRAAVRG